MKRILILTFGLLVFLAYNEITFSQASKELLPYLNENTINLEAENPRWDKLFDSTFYHNQVFLLGERHGIAYSYDALWTVFKHLKERTNFKYYLLEAPLYWEIYLNQYIETGNEKYLKKVFQEAKGTFYANQNFYEFYQKLYAYNHKLSAQDKIKFVSIDVEHQYKNSHAMLLNIIKESLQSKTDSLPFIKYFFDHDPEKTGEYQQTYKNYLIEWQKDSVRLKKHFKNNYLNTSYLIKNINRKFIANSDKKDLARDSLMYVNFKERTVGLDIAKNKAFGFMGIDHCYLSPTKNTKYFGAYIPKKILKTTSIIMLYSNSETLVPTHYLPKFLHFFYGEKAYFTTKMRSNDKIFERQKHISILKDIANTNIYLFNLNKKGSPFGKKSFFVDDLKTKKPTTDFFQSVILIMNSPASKPF
jgi:hypothetical protein